MSVDSFSQVYLNKQLSTYPMYAQKIAQLYGAAVTQKDFSNPNKAAESINDDISERTRYQISDVISPGTDC